MQHIAPQGAEKAISTTVLQAAETGKSATIKPDNAVVTMSRKALAL